MKTEDKYTKHTCKGERYLTGCIPCSVKQHELRFNISHEEALKFVKDFIKVNEEVLGKLKDS